MAKKESKKKADADADAPKDLGEAVRTTLERTFQAYTEGAQTTGERTRAVIDEIAAAAARVRQTMTDTRVLDELQGLRREVDALAQRVAALETAKTARRTAARKPATTTAKTGSTTKRATGTRRSSSSTSSSSSS
jgi:hypothetical protein